MSRLTVHLWFFSFFFKYIIYLFMPCWPKVLGNLLSLRRCLCRAVLSQVRGQRSGSVNLTLCFFPCYSFKSSTMNQYQTSPNAASWESKVIMTGARSLCWREGDVTVTVSRCLSDNALLRHSVWQIGFSTLASARDPKDLFMTFAVVNQYK